MKKFKELLKDRKKREPALSKRKNKMIVLRKKQLAGALLVMLVAIAGYLNWSFKYDVVDPDVSAVYNEASKRIGEAQMVNAKSDLASKEDEYFSQARDEREKKRDETIETLLELIDTDGADKASKENAEKQIQMLADYTEKEVMMENMIKAKGYRDTIVFMSDNLISIAVMSDGLNEVDATVLSDIATSVSGYSADKVNIVEV